MAERVAIITGGLTGIGKAIAERFLADGIRACIGARRADDLPLSLALRHKGRDRH